MYCFIFPGSIKGKNALNKLANIHIHFAMCGAPVQHLAASHSLSNIQFNFNVFP